MPTPYLNRIEVSVSGIPLDESWDDTWPTTSKQTKLCGLIKIVVSTNAVMDELRIPIWIN